MLRKAIVIVALFGFAHPSVGQEVIQACETQRELEQVIGSGGEIMPKGCRQMTVSVLEADGERLCLIDLSAEGTGIVDRLREAAVAEQWWLRCDDLQAASR